MALSALDDRSRRPTPADLARVLRRTRVRWDDLIAHVAAEYPPMDAAIKMAN